MAGPWEKYQSAAPSAPDAAGPWSKYAATPSEIPAARQEPSFMSKVGQQVGNLAAGAVRGAGSIGATIIRPFESAEENAARRKAMDEALQTMGAEPDSFAYGAGKIGAEIAGTAGAAGLAARGLAAVPGVAAAAPGFLQAVKTSGMAGPSLATRVAGGATAGALGAGMVNPDEAGAGAAVGGALPLAGKALSAAGKVLRGPEQSAELAKAVTQARDLGYVIPPTQAKGSFVNRLLEGAAGKITTAQNASVKNQEVTNQLAAKAIGLADDVKISPEVLETVRKDAGQAYRDVAALPVKPAQAADPLSNIPASPEINPEKLVFDLRKARNDATAWYNSYARTADPDSLAKAQAAKSLATSIETGLEDYANSIGRSDLVPAMVEARKLIAKTWSVEKALNPATGTIDAKKFANELKKNKPLSGELKQIAEFASTFPKAAQTVEGMGSLPQWSPLDLMTGAGITAATANPLGIAGVMARPAARALALSPLVQNRLVQGANAPLLNQLNQQRLYQAAPIFGAQ